MWIFLTLIEYLVMSLLSLTRPRLPGILTANVPAMTEHLNPIYFSTYLNWRALTLHLLILSICLNTWTSFAWDSAVSIEGYTLVRRDQCRSGGGVAMYIRNVIDYKIRSDLSDPDLEFLYIEMQKSKAKSFLLQTGTDPRIQQLSYLISSRPFWEILKRKMLNQIKYTRRYQLWHDGSYP